MNVGKTLFAQVMDFVPWRSFGRIRFREGLSARLLAHGEMVHRASRKPFSIAIFSNARWRGEFREGVNRDGARLFQHSMSATAQMALTARLCVEPQVKEADGRRPLSAQLSYSVLGGVSGVRVRSPPLRSGLEIEFASRKRRDLPGSRKTNLYTSSAQDEPPPLLAPTSSLRLPILQLSDPTAFSAPPRVTSLRGPSLGSIKSIHVRPDWVCFAG
jgi:hypothetical protein